MTQTTCFAYEDVLYAMALAVGLDASLERPGDLVKRGGWDFSVLSDLSLRRRRDGIFWQIT